MTNITKNTSYKVNTICLCIIISLTILSCTDSNNYKASASDSSSVDTSINDSLNKTKPKEVNNNWSYNNDEDKMTSRKTYMAYTEAKDLLQFDFPYDGGSTTTLVLRKKNGITDAYIQVSKGQFHGTYDDLKIRIRFDKLTPVYNSYSKSSDGSSDIIFIDNEVSFIKRIKKHKTLLVEAEFFQAGLKQMEFDISNLKWDY